MRLLRLTSLKNNAMLTISQLFVYPVKSLGGTSVTSAMLTERGFEHDRRWMLVDENNQFLSQRECAGMALLQAERTEDSLLITHKISGDKIILPLQPQTTSTMMVDIWSDRCRAQMVSDEANEWLSQMLSLHCKLVYMPDTTRRRVDGRYAINKEITSFSDGYPTLIIGQASLDDLNKKLEHPLGMDRFRPNIVFTGGDPYEEDNFKHFKINNLAFFGVKLCGRCNITTINQNTGEKSKEPLRTLATYRYKNNKIYFGQNLLHKGEGSISVGDAIEVIERKEKPGIFNNVKSI